ncbi:MAG: FAD-dependent oxidoreductase [Pseudomonadota bacterium]
MSGNHTMDNGEQAVIVGGGHAAGELAIALRRNGWEGGITLVGEEPYLPYQRPPLSKDYLAGDMRPEALYLRPRSSYDEARVTLLTGVRVERIDRDLRTLTLSNGAQLPYSKLALATGGRPRRLALADEGDAARADNLHYLRTIADVERIQRQLKPGARLVIVGGGYVGLEMAASASRRGVGVTVLEAQPRVLARVTAPVLSAFYERVHREAGVQIRTGVEVTALETCAARGAVSALHCSDGTRVEADLVVVGIGLIPNIELAREAGLETDNGIVVDEYAQTGDADIVAAGDCACYVNRAGGGRMRLESVQNAVDQARTAAATLCGKRQPHNAVPWFWSDQYDLKLKMAGLSQGYQQLVLRGSPEGRSFSAFYLKDGRVISADTVNRPVEFMVAKRLIAESIPVDAAVLADEGVDLKTLLAKA